MVGFFFQSLFLYKGNVGRGWKWDVSYMGHKERELEFGCSDGDDLGVNFCHKIKKMLAEYFPSEGWTRTWYIETASDGPIK